ncbi:alpha-glucan family phosphorylase [Thiolapillus brandeum]|uniref:Starch phosphorylase n=1 Tax=Thiolapillus brandeum TaxID=1076588 RepID=A0A7U6GJF1_9GAMM|nr:alpha-glucan family phosphorylase [Thiolapillus brandeum]BAO44683.1 starch phosphorylase [Thiolapillus brandeum]
MKTSYDFVRPDLPANLEALGKLALDLRWSWSHVADELWQRIDSDLWHRTRNPWLILQTVSIRHLQDLSGDEQFLELLKTLRQEQQHAAGNQAWFQEQGYADKLASVAYFSMEFGLSEALPIYSGGLGVLAGDHLKTASELGLPLTAVGLLYQQGYFRQGLDAEGRQLAFYPYNDPTLMPVRPARDASGEWLQVSLPFPGRELLLRVWEVRLGRIKLYLLDSNHPLNRPADRGVTSELYGGGAEMRLQQEMVLGLGGYTALEALGAQPEICHLNEGHAALVVLARARRFMQQHCVDFSTAFTATRAGNLFTTHTPVEAGFDRFDPSLVNCYLKPLARDLKLSAEALLALGHAPGSSSDTAFQMAWLALHGSGHVNAVSRLHGEVSRKLFSPLFPRWPLAEVPVSHVTNGVHTSTWDSHESDRLWTRICGKERWRGNLTDMEESIHRATDVELWETRTRNRQQLISWLHDQPLGIHNGNNQAVEFDPNTLTLGFARRFATYKRPNLLLQDPARLAHLLTDGQRPVQLLIAGKAHPRDHAGQQMIQEWIQFIRNHHLQHKVVFIPDYDLLLAEQLVQGIDLWINTPRRPWEACGTSGMKVLVNGGLNLSELDGWWAEAWSPEVGWALGDGQEHGDDPAWDRSESRALYDILEAEVLPLFYQRDHAGIPRQWVARMRMSMATLTPRFSSNRMLRQYTESHYLPMAAACRKRSIHGARLASQISSWQGFIKKHWGGVYFGQVESRTMENQHVFDVQVYLDDIPPDLVAVEVYADPADKPSPERYPMKRVKALAGAVNGYAYLGVIPAQRPISHYTVRVLPQHPEVSIPLEERHILWAN